jgi:hypothetical protein
MSGADTSGGTVAFKLSYVVNYRHLIFCVIIVDFPPPPPPRICAAFIGY